MTTTFETLRDEQAALIAALTPVSLEDVPFVQHIDERPLRDWAQEYPQACFRRFAIADVFDYMPPAISTYGTERVEGSHEVVIAYPVDYRYGAQNRRDRWDVMREDEKYVDERIGLNHAYNAYSEGHCVRTSAVREEGPAVAFLVMTYVFRFDRAC